MDIFNRNLKAYRLGKENLKHLKGLGYQYFKSSDYSFYVKPDKDGNILDDSIQVIVKNNGIIKLYNLSMNNQYEFIKFILDNKDKPVKWWGRKYHSNHSFKVNGKHQRYFHYNIIKDILELSKYLRGEYAVS